jgi:ribosomal protein S12 methylthiotransferase accessory factor
MQLPLSKGFDQGTHRLIAPEATLENIRPHLTAADITRSADVTGLDRIGIPVYCAIRPLGKTVQVTNGKGLRHVDAKVSALMEAIELFHAETPHCRFERASFNDLRRAAKNPVRPHAHPDFAGESFFSQDFIINWVPALDLLAREEVLLPSCSAYISSPKLHPFSTNGLASGNHLIEATLHAIYEVVERDAIAGLEHEGRITFAPERCRFMNPKTLPEGPLRFLNETLARAQVKLVLIWLKARVPIHTFMAVILDDANFSQATTVNIGYGSHLNETVAAIRAITEAAQTRLTYIHGSRQDIKKETYVVDQRMLFEFFSRLDAATPWHSLAQSNNSNLSEDYEETLSHLRAAGFRNLFRVDMTREPFNIPVVKVVIPGMRIIKV